MRDASPLPSSLYSRIEFISISHHHETKYKKKKSGCNPNPAKLVIMNEQDDNPDTEEID
jgi:hypothetical protein